MALTEICDAITVRLREIPGVLQVPDSPPPQLPDDRMLVVYPQPGSSTPMQHGGRGGQVVIQSRDVIVVEWHLLEPLDRVDRFLALGVPLLDTMRDSLWSTFLRNRFDQTVVQLHAVDTNQFGEMRWGSEPKHWGFRLTLDVTHAAEVSAGRER